MDARPPLIATLLLMIATTASGQTYRCDAKGRTAYQQFSCPNGSISTIYDAGIVPPSAEAIAAADAVALTQAVLLHAQQKDRRRQQIEDAIAAHEVMDGMTPAEVQRSWGAPTRITKSASRLGLDEQWTYRACKRWGEQHVRFVDGVVRLDGRTS